MTARATADGPAPGRLIREHLSVVLMAMLPNIAGLVLMFGIVLALPTQRCAG